ncbi:hypothetical protein [Nocardia stercoris]|nr:hypothetical protein [Nocardia stercoris]
MNASSSTADILHRQLVLPVRATRAGLGAAAGQDPAAVARHTATVIPALTAAADRVADRRGRLEQRAEKHTATRSFPDRRRAAYADALAAVDGIHTALTTAAARLDR